MDSSMRHASIKSSSYPHTAFDLKHSDESAGSSSAAGGRIMRDKQLAPMALRKRSTSCGRCLSWVAGCPNGLRHVRSKRALIHWPPGRRCARRDQVAEPRSGTAGIWHRRAKQQDPARTGQCRRSGQFAEVLVKGQENTLLAVGPREHIWIAHTRGRMPHPHDIVPAAISAVTAVPGKFSLARKRISVCAGEDPFRTQRVTRICEASHVGEPDPLRRDMPLVGHSRSTCKFAWNAR